MWLVVVVRALTQKLLRFRQPQRHKPNLISAHKSVYVRVCVSAFACACVRVCVCECVRAIAAAAAIGMLGTVVLLGLAFFLAPLLGLTLLYLLWLGLIGIGYEMGAGVSLSVNRKRGRGLQWVVGVAMVLVFLAISPIVGLSLNSLFGILALGFSLYIAVRQLGL